MINIKKIQLKNLQEFVESDLFLSFKNKPISILRVVSYLNNPNAQKDDFCLYLALVNNKLVAYRTLFTDSFIYKKQKQKFCWLSGSWTHRDYRRKGISSKLFKEIYNDWNGKIIFSNYAKNSKALYDKTNMFTVLKTLKGKRYYRRICLAEILPNKNNFFNKIKPLLIFIDWTLNLFLDFRFVMNPKIKSKYKMEKIGKWEKDIEHYLIKFKEKELFQRTIETYQWIQKYPWIKSDLDTKKAAKQYNFSLYAKKFNNDFYKISNPKTTKIIAVINISIRDKQLKIPYLYSSPDALNIIKILIYKLCDKHKINHITIYHNLLNNLIKKDKKLFLKQKVFNQNYFISKTLLEEFEGMASAETQTGDGDGVFT
ncbi:MAG: GNAT family N-acetyltransferase [Flavobacteriaceae bacterium]|nr:GNAT family N-acetyltransferase [Flavobacteriaceae bacterium]